MPLNERTKLLRFCGIDQDPVRRDARTASRADKSCPDPSGDRVAVYAESLRDFVDGPFVGSPLVRSLDAVGDGVVSVIHSRDLGTTDEAERLLRGIEGLELRPVPAADRCCGFGGAFAVDEPEISSEMGRDKARAVALTGAELLVTGDSGCALQIHGTLLRSGRSIRVAHVAEVIAESLDLEILGEPARERGGER